MRNHHEMPNKFVSFRTRNWNSNKRLLRDMFY